MTLVHNAHPQTPYAERTEATSWNISSFSLGELDSSSETVEAVDLVTKACL